MTPTASLRVIVLALGMSLGLVTGAAPGPAQAADQAIVVNGEVLGATDIRAIEAMVGGRLVPGRYWYDRTAGLWGYEGGPTAGFARAGLPFGGALRANASKGNTGVFFNGRELHLQEVNYLRSLGPVYPGRYSLNAIGYVAFEGQALPFAHLPTLHQQRWGSQSSTTPGGAYIANGGGCMYISGKNSSGVGSWGASTC